MRRILFVDDEANVLEGLRRTLRPLRHEWEMEFALGGQEALKLMTLNPVDVIVSDMRMPGMDGDELLANVRNIYPRTVRIALTGQCTRQAMLRLARLAHRVFTKPCNSDGLKAAVHCACSLQDLLRAPTLVTLVSQLGGLPTPPATYVQILAELEKPDGSIIEVGNLLAQDLGMSAKLMQITSSSMFGLRSPTPDPVRAVQILGAETTKALVLLSDVFSRFDPACLFPYSIDDMWKHSQQVSDLAGKIAEVEATKECVANARLAGFMHDVGRLLLASQRPALYKEVLQLAHLEQMPMTDAERQVFGATHAEVGAFLLGLWGLPTQLVEAVAWHHNPLGCVLEGFTPLTAVHAAETLLALDEGDPTNLEYLDHLGLGGRLDEWRQLTCSAEFKGAEP